MCYTHLKSLPVVLDNGQNWQKRGHYVIETADYYENIEDSLNRIVHVHAKKS